MQAALAQKTALSMAQSADWTTELMGLPGLLTDTSAGKQWDEAVTRAQEDCAEAIASLGSLTQFLRSQEQACTWLTCALSCKVQGTACTCSGVSMQHKESPALLSASGLGSRWLENRELMQV